MNKEKALTIFLWIWVGGAMAAYMVQFAGLIRSVLKLVGAA